MTKSIHDIPLLLLVVIAALLAFGLWALGLSGLAEPIRMGDSYLSKSVAGLAKDALFKPLKPLMYALIILSIGSSLAISTGGLGAKFARVFSFFIGFSLLAIVIGIAAFNLFAGFDILPDPSSVSAGGGKVTQKPFMMKIYDVLSSELMVAIYAGILFGSALKRLGLGRQADEISDLFIKGFRKFLQYTIPLSPRLQPRARLVTSSARMLTKPHRFTPLAQRSIWRAHSSGYCYSRSIPSKLLALIYPLPTWASLDCNR